MLLVAKPAHISIRNPFPSSVFYSFWKFTSIIRVYLGFYNSDLKNNLIRFFQILQGKRLFEWKNVLLKLFLLKYGLCTYVYMYILRLWRCTFPFFRIVLLLQKRFYRNVLPPDIFNCIFILHRLRVLLTIYAGNVSRKFSNGIQFSIWVSIMALNAEGNRIESYSKYTLHWLLLLLLLLLLRRI